jgi:hypothetical protein
LTKRELSQLYYLKKEIANQQKRIEELEALAQKCTSQITGLPHVVGVSDRVGKYTSELSDLRNLLDLNIKKCFFELNKLDRYIQSVPDSDMRLILTLRYVQNLNWQKIAFYLNYQDESVVRKRHNRYFIK